MIVIGTEAAGAAKRRAIDEDFHKGEWMDSGQEPGLSPTVFLSEQRDNCTLMSHFHRENQFQLFVDGSGTIGRHELGPFMVHYAGAFTGYGPIVSGSEGLKYFTIRARYDAGLIPAAEARERMPRGPKRHATSHRIQPSTAQELLARREPVEEELIPAADGMGAYLTRLPPGSAYAIKHVEGSEGCFVFVVNGELSFSGRSLRPWEHVFVTPDEQPDLVTSSMGAEVIAMSIPPRDPAYSEAPTALSAIATGELVPR